MAKVNEGESTYWSMFRHVPPDGMNFEWWNGSSFGDKMDAGLFTNKEKLVTIAKQSEEGWVYVVLKIVGVLDGQHFPEVIER